MEKEHLEMILEDINGKFDLVLEGYAALDKKLDNRFDELNEKIENNSFKIEILNQKIDGVEERLTKRIDGFEQNLSNKLDTLAEAFSAHHRDTEVHRGYQVRED